MRVLFKVLFGMALLMGMAVNLTSCGEDSVDINKNKTEEGYSGKLTLSGDGITVNVTKANKSGDNFFEIFFNAVNNETPRKTHNREVVFTIKTTDGQIYSQTETIYGNNFEHGNTYAGRALMQIDPTKQLDKKTVTIVSIKPMPM